MKSVFQKNKECYCCGTTMNIHEHHIFGGPNRKACEKRGLKIFLCAYHHNMSDEGIHFDKAYDLYIKQMAQKYYEEFYGTRSDFRREFIRSYL